MRELLKTKMNFTVLAEVIDHCIHQAEMLQIEIERYETLKTEDPNCTWYQEQIDEIDSKANAYIAFAKRIAKL